MSEPFDLTTPRQPGGNMMPLSGDLQTLIDGCSDVEEFRTLLQRRGIWLNRRAAESAFGALRRATGSGELSDDELSVVTGGATVVNESTSFIQELLHYL